MCGDEPELKCPNCGARVDARSPSDSPFFPFCSQRCRLLDLGKWLDEEHRIEGPFEPGRQDTSEQG